MIRLAVAVLLCALAGPACAQAVDEAHLLSADELARVKAEVELHRTWPAIAVAVLPWVGSHSPSFDRPRLGSYSSYSILGPEMKLKENYRKHWNGPPRRGRVNGLVLVVAPPHTLEGTDIHAPLQVDVEVDGQLEQRVTADLATKIVRDTLAPALGANHPGDGLVESIRAFRAAMDAGGPLPAPGPLAPRALPATSWFTGRRDTLLTLALALAMAGFGVALRRMSRKSRAP